MKKFARKRDWLDQFKDYRMAAICSLQWINDGMKNLITNTCFIFKVFYRCLMNTDCNIILREKYLFDISHKHCTFTPFHAITHLNTKKRHPSSSHFDACTVTQALQYNLAIWRTFRWWLFRPPRRFQSSYIYPNMLMTSKLKINVIKLCL